MQESQTHTNVHYFHIFIWKELDKMGKLATQHLICTVAKIFQIMYQCRIPYRCVTSGPTLQFLYCSFEYSWLNSFEQFCQFVVYCCKGSIQISFYNLKFSCNHLNFGLVLILPIRIIFIPINGDEVVLSTSNTLNTLKR